MVEEINYEYFEQQESGRFSLPDDYKDTNVLKKTVDFVTLLNHREMFFYSKDRFSDDNGLDLKILFIYEKEGCAICFRDINKLKTRHSCYGIIIDRKWLLMIWFYLDNIICYLMGKSKKLLKLGNSISATEFYDRGLLRSENDKKINNYIEMVKQIIDNNRPIDFIIGNELWGLKPYITTFPLDEFPEERTLSEHQLTVRDIKEIFRDCENEEIKTINESILNDSLTYRFPNIKDRPHFECYFKERKRIKEDIKNGKIYWNYKISDVQDERIVVAKTPEKGIFLIDDLLDELKTYHTN